MLERIYKQLELRFPQVTASFGGADNFLEVLSQNSVYSYEIDAQLNALLSHADATVVITPTNLTFKLYEVYSGVAESNSIQFEEPYSVHNLEGQLLYRVSEHNGIFGYSPLDRALLLQSKPGQFYYLHYSTYTGKRTLLLVVNVFMIESKKKVAIGPTLREQQPVELLNQSLNTILFKLSNGQRDMSQPGLPLYPVRVYFLQSPPGRVPSRTEVTTNPISEKTEYEMELDSSFVIHPQTSGWLVFNQVTRSGELPLEIQGMTGAGVHRLIEASPGVYYVGVSSEISLNQLNQALNVLGRVDTEMGNQVINLRVELVQVS